MERVIWQYWETKGTKPLFVDGLYEIAKKNSGVEVIQVTPQTLEQYVPDVPEELFKIGELAHKADMIRTMLVCRHGGMWLDSDAIVLSDLNWLFDVLSDCEFVGFNDNGSIHESPLNVRVNCFLSRPDSRVLSSWVKAQHSKFPKTTYSWSEVGTELLDPIVAENIESVRLLDFDIVCPVKWNEVDRFTSKWRSSKRLLDNTSIVMLSNKILQDRGSRIVDTPLDELSEEGTLLADILKRAHDADYAPPGALRKAVSAMTRGLR